MTAQTRTDITTYGHDGNEDFIRTEGLKKYYPVTRGLVLQRTVGMVMAVDGVSFNIPAGQT